MLKRWPRRTCPVCLTNRKAPSEDAAERKLLRHLKQVHPRSIFALAPLFPPPPMPAFTPTPVNPQLDDGAF